MIGFKRLFLLLNLIFLLMSSRTEAQVNPRIKTLTVAGVYGVVGGALLGLASLSFGTKARSPFIGASLGLYAGLLFGSYVVGSHAYKRFQWANPYLEESSDDSSSFYEDTGGQGGLFGGGDFYEYRPSFEMKGWRQKKLIKDIPLRINMLMIQF